MLKRRFTRNTNQSTKTGGAAKTGLLIVLGLVFALSTGCATDAAEQAAAVPPEGEAEEPLIFDPEGEPDQIAAAEPEEEAVEPEEPAVEPEEEPIEPEDEEPVIIPDDEEILEDPEDLIIPEEEPAENGFEEARPQIQEQLQQQVVNEYVMDHLAELREESTIDIDEDVLDEGEAGDVVALVNDEELLMDRVLEAEGQQLQQLEMMGVDMESEEAQAYISSMRPEILNDIINTLLVTQKAEETGMAATDDMVDQQFQMFIEQAGGIEQMEAQLEQAGMTEEELKEMISMEISVQAYLNTYLEENLDPADLEFTEEEMREIYESQQQMQEMEGMEDMQQP